MVSIVQKDDPILREVAQAVNQKDFGTPALRKILKDIAITMEKEEDGVAMAAPQIRVPLRIFIVSHRVFEYADGENEHNQSENLTTQEAKHQKIKRANMVFINPVTIKLSKRKRWVPEGCLSVRWLYGEVERNDKVTVRAYDENGKAFTWGGSGLLAQIFQHETDHLNGTLFIDTARHLEEITAEEQRLRREEEDKK